MIKGVIFDLDGTLVDTMPIWNNLAYKYLIQYNIIPPDDIDKIVSKMSSQTSCRYIQKTFLPHLSVEEVTNGLHNLIVDEYIKAPLKKGALNFIKYLKSNNIKMCITTAGDKTLATKCLEQKDILKYFEFILTCEDVNASKETPKIFDTATKSLNLSKKDVLVFEDSDHCIDTIVNSGYKSIRIYDKYSNNETSAHFSFNNFDEILNSNKNLKILGF